MQYGAFMGRAYAVLTGWNFTILGTVNAWLHSIMSPEGAGRPDLRGLPGSFGESSITVHCHHANEPELGITANIEPMPEDGHSGWWMIKSFLYTNVIGFLDSEGARGRESAYPIGVHDFFP
jgi:hypothetical protein